MSELQKQENQIKIGCRFGTQRCRCKELGTRYTLNPNKHEYPDEIKKLAIKIYEVSKQEIEKVLGNVYS